MKVSFNHSDDLHAPLNVEEDHRKRPLSVVIVSVCACAPVGVLLTLLVVYGGGV